MTAINDVQALQTLTVYTSDVNSVDFAGDCVLVTGSGDKCVRVWEWQSGTGYVEAYFSPLLGHKYGVTSVKVSPQSTMLATSSIDGTTLLWNLRMGTKIHTMVQIGGEAVRVCRFSPDSTLLATAGDNGQVCLWDLVHRNLIRCFQRHEGAVQGLSFSPDSSWLITSCTLGVLKLFSTAELLDVCTSSNQEITELVTIDDVHDMGIVCCDFSTFQEVTCNEPYTKLYQLVTCGNDNDVKLWEVIVSQNKCEAQPTATVQLLRVMEKHSSTLTCVRFSNNGLYIASTSLDKTAVIWETSTGKIANIISGHNRYIACCAFSRDGNLLATGSNDKTTIVWNLTGNLTINSEFTKNIGAKWFRNNPEKNTMHEQNVMTNVEMYANEVTLIQRLEEHNGAVNSVTFYGNNLLASASGDKLVRIWSVETEEEDGEEVTKLHEKPFSPLDGHTYSVNYVEFSPCGTMLASCSLDGTTLIWNTEDGAQAKPSFVNSCVGIRVCRWSPDGIKIATAGDDEKTTLWDVETMDKLGVYEGHVDAISAIAFTHDSRYLVTACNEGTWRLFDTLDEKSGNEALMVCDSSHDLGVQGCDFSPTAGSMICTRDSDMNIDKQVYLLATCGNDSLVKLWHVIISKEISDSDGLSTSKNSKYYKEKKSLAGHGGNVMCVRFSPVHGEVLGSVATDRTARIWSVFSGNCLYVLESHESLVTSCAFSEDTSLFATGALDKTVLIWKVPQQLISQSNLMDSLRNKKKMIADWKIHDTLKWLNDIELSKLSRKVLALGLNGRHLLSLSENELISRLNIEDDEEAVEILKKQLYWLKREDCNITENLDESEIPHEFLCPITHEIMKEPVQCSDGFTYERAAINEWFLCGKYTSPMTNTPLHDTSFTPNIILRNAILTLLHGEKPQ